MKRSTAAAPYAAIAFAGLICLAAMQAHAATYFSWTNSPADGPGTAWSNAFHTIQGAVNAATNAGDVVRVTNGVYSTDGAQTPGSNSLMCRVVISNAILVESVNGPAYTVIAGQGPLGDSAVRCVYMTNDPVLSGFTLSGGHTRTNGWILDDQSGGGVYAAGGILTNCIITGNSAGVWGGGMEGGTNYGCVFSGNSSGQDGGGVDFSESHNSVFIGNSAIECGGGASYSLTVNCLFAGNSAGHGGAAAKGEVRNCVVVSNAASVEGGGGYDMQIDSSTVAGNTSAGIAGGAFRGTIRNSIVYYNSDPGGSNVYGSACDHVCTTPAVVGTGNITNQPGFADYAATNLHLLGSSMCINAGNNDYVLDAADIEGNTRVKASVVDMGALESPYAPIDASVRGHGTITPSGRIGVLVSSNQSFTMAETAGYPPMRDAEIDGVSIGPTNAYTFYGLNSNHTIRAFYWAYPDSNGFAIVRLGVVNSTNLVFALPGTNGWSYTLQQAADLLSPAWSNVVPHVNLAGPGTIVITNAISPAVSQQFFRVWAVEQ